MDQIRMLALSFNYYDEIDIDQARELLVVAGTKFLSTINSNEKLRPFLKNTPFTTENIEIRIFVQKPNGKEPDQGKLTVLSMVDGILSYKVDNPETNRFRTILKETFEEAEAKRICIPCTSSQEAL